jgi:hypothetical protein
MNRTIGTSDAGNYRGYQPEQIGPQFAVFLEGDQQ